MAKIKTKEHIIRSAMNCISELGLEHTTFQAIADKAKVSQPLVVYHLKTRENIFHAVFQYILDTSLLETEQAIAKTPSAKEALTAYIDVSLKYFRSHHGIPIVYLTFYYLSSFNSEYRMINDKLKAEAIQRIMGILAVGMAKKEFKIVNPNLTAKIIHTNITGLLLNLACEKTNYTDEELLKELKKSCLAHVGV